MKSPQIFPDHAGARRVANFKAGNALPEESRP
jgi:hypothetical protein